MGSHVAEIYRESVEHIRRRTAHLEGAVLMLEPFE